ncbi:putative flocculation suppression protein [Botrytis cinerea BcDW1]|uniref:Putative flocculation suppression protein n=1 Tax=Botryotinia fuckeliana (strain BcDW1) TaxID=1290391 RepID=M7TGW9_BOTF1|nr:putative flocculation suppression protein [Botrytis cinerea BcDW1]
MDVMDDRGQQHSYINGPSLGQIPARTVPIIQQPTLQPPASSGDAMDVTPPGSAIMGPPSRTSPDNEANGLQEHMIVDDQPSSGSLATPSAAAAAAAGGGIQPKVVQTAFIHKLYSMLEDVNIRHLISWSATQDSFVMSPSSDFSKVLSNAVSDVFHQNAPETPLWEFKHGQNSFKRGDVVGLREIRRRASRQSLVHRDSYSAPKPPLSQPGTPGEPIQPIQESTESRLIQLEHGLFDMHAKQAREAENQQFFHVRHQGIMDILTRVLQMNYEMSRMIASLSGADSGLHRDVATMQDEIQRQLGTIRGMEEVNEPPTSSSRPYFSNLTLDNPPSPRQVPQDDPRRSSFLGVPPRQNFHRPPIPSHLSLSARRGYGSIGGTGTGQPSPSSLRAQAPPPAPAPAPPPHPLANASSPPTNLSRRHTSADIRNVVGWQPTSSPFASGQSSSQYPSSPKRTATHMANEDQRIRDSFSMYSLAGATHGHSMSRPTTPPYTNGNPAEHLNSWSWGGSKDRERPGLFRDNSGPPTRRGSMAHILNPAETAERAEEHEEEMLREEDRKRKRLQ